VAVRQQSIIAQSGPLPPSSDFASYERTLPGAAERILVMAERHGEARREREREALRLDRVGQYFGFIVTIISLWGFGFLVYMEKPLLSVGLAVFGLANIAAVFIGQKYKR
jgi:uncharacterized membrane protein